MSPDGQRCVGLNARAILAGLMADPTPQTIQPTSTPPNAPPFGTFAPTGWKRVWLALCHRAPTRRMALWLRKPLKRAFQPSVDVRIWGLELRLNPLGNLSEQRWALMPHHIDAQERRFLETALQDGDVFLDIGANVGLYALWVASRPNRRVRVEAFEPDSELCARLEWNRRHNRLEHVTAHPLALGRTEGHGDLRRHAVNRGQNVIETHSQGPLRVRPLFSITQELEITRLKALKIDVEGAELDILEPFFDQSPKTLWPTFILCERLANGETDPLGRLLSQNGYRLILRTRMNGVYERKP